MRRVTEIAGPLALIGLVAVLGSVASPARALEFDDALVAVSFVVALYVFVGNSGVLSFGQTSFVAVGAFAAGVMTAPADSKAGQLPDLFPFLRDHSIGNVPSLLLATGIGGLYALLVGMPLMRLSGLSAGIATFAVLGITHNVLRYWTEIGPGAGTLALVPESTGLIQASVGAMIIVGAAFAYQSSRFGRMLRASREDAPAAQAVGVNVHRQRLWAFVLSGALSGLAGGLFVHETGTLTTEQVYLDLTFLTLAMLVIGGAYSLWGAVLGALLVSGFNSFLGDAENGIHIGVTLHAPTGTRVIALGAVMTLTLLLRPTGVTGGREFSLGWLGRRSPKRSGGTNT
jgi:branched-chain amino acid transport system permease protein